MSTKENAKNRSESFGPMLYLSRVASGDLPKLANKHHHSNCGAVLSGSMALVLGLLVFDWRKR